MDEEERRALDERVAHSYRTLAKQICAVAMESWKRCQIRLALMGPPETERTLPIKQYRVVRHLRSELQDRIDDIEDFFASDWYKDILCGLVPEMSLCPFDEYKKQILKDIKNGDITDIEPDPED